MTYLINVGKGLRHSQPPEEVSCVWPRTEQPLPTITYLIIRDKERHQPLKRVSLIFSFLFVMYRSEHMTSFHSYTILYRKTLAKGVYYGN